MGETTTAAPLLRRGLVHASRTVNQNGRDPALDLRDAHAADVTSLSVYGGRERRSRRAGCRWQPDNRESYHRYDNQTKDPDEYQEFSFHFRPPL